MPFHYFRNTVENMGYVKRFLENLSVEMGFDGEITDEVMAEGERRFAVHEKELQEQEAKVQDETLRTAQD